MAGTTKNYLAIDPDIKECGIAIWDGNIMLENLSPSKIIALFYTQGWKTWQIRIEAGWLNKSNWHTKEGQSDNVAAEIGRRTGENHATGKLIAECAKMVCKDVVLVRPTGKKLTPKQFKELAGIECKNQDQIDAGRLLLDVIIAKP